MFENPRRKPILGGWPHVIGVFVAIPLSVGVGLSALDEKFFPDPKLSPQRGSDSVSDIIAGSTAMPPLPNTNSWKLNNNLKE